MAGKYRGTINRDKVLWKQLQGQGDPKPVIHSANSTSIQQSNNLNSQKLKQLFHLFVAVRLRTKYAN